MKLFEAGGRSLVVAVSRQTPGEGENAAGFRAVNAQPELCPGILSTDSEAQRASNLAGTFSSPCPPLSSMCTRPCVYLKARFRVSTGARISARVPVNDGVEALEYRQLLPSLRDKVSREPCPSISVFRLVRSFSGFTRCGDLERAVRSPARIYKGQKPFRELKILDFDSRILFSRTRLIRSLNRETCSLK